MEIFSKIIYAVMLLSALGIIILVLLQHGKGADMGTGFGAGASGSLFGASGSANFLSRSTAVLAATFFLSTLSLSWISGHRTLGAPGPGSDNLPGQIAPAAKPSDVPAAGAVPGAVAPAPAPKGTDIPK